MKRTGNKSGSSARKARTEFTHKITNPRHSRGFLHGARPSLHEHAASDCFCRSRRKFIRLIVIPKPWEPAWFNVSTIFPLTILLSECLCQDLNRFTPPGLAGGYLFRQKRNPVFKRGFYIPAWLQDRPLSMPCIYRPHNPLSISLLKTARHNRYTHIPAFLPNPQNKLRNQFYYTFRQLQEKGYCFLHMS